MDANIAKITNTGVVDLSTSTKNVDKVEGTGKRTGGLRTINMTPAAYKKMLQIKRKLPNDTQSEISNSYVLSLALFHYGKSLGLSLEEKPRKDSTPRVAHVGYQSFQDMLKIKGLLITGGENISSTEVMSRALTHYEQILARESNESR